MLQELLGLLKRSLCPSVCNFRRYPFEENRWFQWNWKKFVRSGVRTHAHIRGPEHSARLANRKVYLESGALDHSAILTDENVRMSCYLLITIDSTI